MEDDNDVLQEQLAYYRARAATYDASLGDGLQGPLTAVAELLQQLGPFEHVLELACGTGIWTRLLVNVTQRLTAVDAAPEMLALNAAKLGKLAELADSRVRYQRADLFTWEPAEQYDLVFFAFWLSHVPPSRLDPWLATVLRAVRPGGSLVIVDEYAPTLEDEQIALDDIYARRPLGDGRTFTIVKVFYALTHLHTRLADQDVAVTAHKLDDRFFLLHGRLRRIEAATSAW
jgi:demethylmenaquinone methyltransferase/2-methoxy-6-polyprenyl-1,4-benzoquinol methylase